MYSNLDFSGQRSFLSDRVALQTTSDSAEQGSLGLGSIMAEKTGRARKLGKLFIARGKSCSVEEDPPQDDFPPGNKIRYKILSFSFQSFKVSQNNF